LLPEGARVPEAPLTVWAIRNRLGSRYRSGKPRAGGGRVGMLQTGWGFCRLAPPLEVEQAAAVDPRHSIGEELIIGCYHDP